MKKFGDVEPSNYFPTAIRKKYKLGEYADNETVKTGNKKASASKKDPKK